MAKATQIVHWPGKDVPACDAHREQMLGVAEAMGFKISWTPCAETECPNCEAKGQS